MKDYGKSRDYRQRASKSGIEERSEDDEIKKIKEILDKLDKEVKSNPMKISSKATSKFTILGENNNILGQNVSFMGRTGKGINEDKNNREFLLNFLSHDNMPILPKNLHLLTDNDANQNISESTKFKNLADLLIDNTDSVVESHFVRDCKERVNLSLFTAFSRKSKDVLLDENPIEQDKNRLLLLKLNNVNIPTLNIIDKNEYEQKYKIKDMQYRENLLKNILKPLNPINENNNKKENKENFENKNCIYFRQKEEKYFVMPTLINYIPPSKENLRKTFSKGRSVSMRKVKEKKNKDENSEQNEKVGYSSPRTSRATSLNTLKKLEKEKNPNFWDPEIDGDILSYINHNIICIEDIYNQNKKDYNYNKKEKDIIPIETKEILNDNDNNDDDEIKNFRKSLKKDLMEDDDNDTGGEKKKIKNKFTEFNDYCPKIAHFNIKKDKLKLQEKAFNNDLKLFINSKIDNITAFHDQSFPKKIINVSSEKLYRYAKNNETNEKSTQDSFSIEPLNKNKNSDEKNSENKSQKTIKDKKNFSIGNSSIKKKNIVQTSKNKNSNDKVVKKNEQSIKKNTEKEKEKENKFKEIQRLFFNINIDDNKNEKDEKMEKNKKEEVEKSLYSIDESDSNVEKSVSKKNYSKNLSKIFKDKDKLNQSSIEKTIIKKVDNSEDSILKLYSSESNKIS